MARPVFSSFDEATRWNTSCCGIEPSIIVTPAATGLRAFPGAEGFGANATGGRGGTSTATASRRRSPTRFTK